MPTNNAGHAEMRDRRPAARFASRGPDPAASAWVTMSVAGLGVLASIGLVWISSYSALGRHSPASSSTAASGDDTVVLSNDRPATALWSTGDGAASPGQPQSKCITVSVPANEPSTVKMYATNGTYSMTRSLADVIDLRIQQGRLLAAGDCGSFAADDSGGDVYRGTLAAFSTRDSFGRSVGLWETSGQDDDVKVYRITVAINPTGSQAVINSYQGGTASIGFTWEAQSR